MDLLSLPAKHGLLIWVVADLGGSGYTLLNSLGIVGWLIQFLLKLKELNLQSATFKLAGCSS